MYIGNLKQNKSIKLIRFALSNSLLFKKRDWYVFQTDVFLFPAKADREHSDFWVKMINKKWHWKMAHCCECILGLSFRDDSFHSVGVQKKTANLHFKRAYFNQFCSNKLCVLCNVMLIVIHHATLAHKSIHVYICIPLLSNNARMFRSLFFISKSKRNTRQNTVSACNRALKLLEHWVVTGFGVDCLEIFRCFFV